MADKEEAVEPVTQFTDGIGEKNKLSERQLLIDFILRYYVTKFCFRLYVRTVKSHASTSQIRSGLMAWSYVDIAFYSRLA